MKIHLIRIGNSLGIRLPKAVIEQCQFEDVIDADIEDGKLILIAQAKKKPREGWEEAFKKVQGKDVPMGQWPTSKFDDEEWEW